MYMGTVRGIGTTPEKISGFPCWMVSCPAYDESISAGPQNVGRGGRYISLSRSHGGYGMVNISHEPRIK